MPIHETMKGEGAKLAGTRGTQASGRRLIMSELVYFKLSIFECALCKNPKSKSKSKPNPSVPNEILNHFLYHNHGFPLHEAMAMLMVLT